MTKVVYHYYREKAMGEANRLLMAYGGQEFEDHRISDEDWPAFKPNTPFGQMPVLELNGKKYAKTSAISRYFGRKYGLVGDTLEDAMEIDQNIDCLNELRDKALSVAYEPDKELQERRHAEYSKTVYPQYLEKLSSIITENNGHIALGKLTWGDFVVAGLIDYLKRMMRMPDLIEKYPAFQTVVDKVYAIPQVKAYADAAPKMTW
nr:GSTS1e [Helicoverpa armigera]